VQHAKLEHHFPFSFKTLVDIRVARYDHLDIWDMFSAVKPLDDKTEGDLRTREYKLMIRTALPLFAQKLLANGEALSCDETTTFNEKTSEFTSFTILKLANSAVQFNERSLYTPDGEGKSKRRIDIEANVKIPGIGRLIEKLIVYEFKEQSEVDLQRILKFHKDNYP
jgi:PRELI-like family